MEEAAAGKARRPTVESLTDGTMRRLAAATVRENVCNNSKKRKKSCFLDFEKKRKKRKKTYI